ncbi:P-loop containing nucleoside triphosphate hydrolase [Pseudocohnilembus persalinus]|uniref:p-loop containing nucleoside triphosphate hydrolase n=1 Tax=Pseudocohnilembus persalinus TaxID=266149 RepID=A0A0V0Q7S6_PSEPJ|nr:P-loop containing nucleoside triphosphate hydrolase [Pseudocohnilembus persalinus]|eukprot:KRW98225.1 P-loop containing nucleoside triphosphate hydrolase [Pseudocohnilembus persalinus]
MSSQSIALCLTYSFTITSVLKDFTMNLVSVERELISLERIYSLFQYKQELTPNDFYQYQLQKKIKNEQTPTIKQIEIKNLEFTYKNQFQKAIKDMNLRIKQGEKIFILGRTGCGKTTILNILLRLYDHYKGQIIINEKDIKQIPLLKLREKIGVVPQHGFIFKGSIRQNIDPLCQYSDYKIFSILGQLGIQNLSRQFKPLDYDIEQNGTNLSQGEKQIINFVRLLIDEQKQILFLDESTANLDKNYQQKFQDVILNQKNKIIFTISHQLENISKYDKCLVLDNGQVKAFQNYQELLNNNFEKEKNFILQLFSRQ